MPRQRVLHLNSPADDEFTVCGKRLARTLWTLMPAQVTCLACKKVMRQEESPYSESMAFKEP